MLFLLNISYTAGFTNQTLDDFEGMKLKITPKNHSKMVFRYNSFNDNFGFRSSKDKNFSYKDSIVEIAEKYDKNVEISINDRILCHNETNLKTFSCINSTKNSCVWRISKRKNNTYKIFFKEDSFGELSISYCIEYNLKNFKNYFFEINPCMNTNENQEFNIVPLEIYDADVENKIGRNLFSKKIRSERYSFIETYITSVKAQLESAYKNVFVNNIIKWY